MAKKNCLSKSFVHMDRKRTRKIVVFHSGALGDSVLIWPMLRGLLHEDWAVIFVSNREKAKLAAHWIHGVLPMDGEKEEFCRLYQNHQKDWLSANIDEFLSHADKVVSFWKDRNKIDQTWVQNITRIAPHAEILHIQVHPPNSLKIPIEQYHKDQIRSHGLEVSLVPAKILHNESGPIVIHPGSGSREKCWPIERIQGLMKFLKDSGKEVILLLGEVERERIDPTILKNWRSNDTVCEPKDLLELSNVLSRARLVIGNDSGPLHLAAQLGIPTLGLFGPTDPRIWAPVPAHPKIGKVLWSGKPASMSWIRLETVVGTAEELFRTLEFGFNDEEAKLQSVVNDC